MGIRKRQKTNQAKDKKQTKKTKKTKKIFYVIDKSKNESVSQNESGEYKFDLSY